MMGYTTNSHADFALIGENSYCPRRIYPSLYPIHVMDQKLDCPPRVRIPVVSLSGSFIWGNNSVPRLPDNYLITISTPYSYRHNLKKRWLSSSSSVIDHLNGGNIPNPCLNPSGPFVEVFRVLSGASKALKTAQSTPLSAFSCFALTSSSFFSSK